MSLLVARDLGLRRNGRDILVAVECTVTAGEFSGLVGPNGAGKSTLLRLLAGIERPDAGTVEYQGQPLATMGPRERARALGYHPQQPEVHWPLSVGNVIALGRLPQAGALTRLTPADLDAIAAAAARAGISALLTRRYDELSGGEQARVHLARLLAGGHRVLLTDEPIANLDPRYQRETLSLLRGHARDGGGVLAALHDLNLAARYCDRLLLMHGGRLLASGRPHEVLTPAQLAAVFDLPAQYLVDSGLDRTAPHGPAERRRYAHRLP